MSNTRTLFCWAMCALGIGINPAFSQTVTNGGLALGVGTEPRGFQADRNIVALWVGEGEQGNIDLNADGDTSDYVLHLHNHASGITVNTGLATLGLIYDVSGSLIGVDVNESAQGGTDLNGDGDIADDVLFLINTQGGIVANLGLAIGGLTMSPTIAAVRVNEFDQGNTDLNGDGDTADGVVHRVDLTTSVVTNLGLATTTNTGPTMGTIDDQGTQWAFLVDEPSQSSTDLNGDGDALDRIQHVHNIATATTTNLGLDVNVNSGVGAEGLILAVMVQEQGQGGDLNGDGDFQDLVPHVHDFRTGVTTNLQLASNGLFPLIDSVSEDYFVFVVDEGDQANTDLNGDGDTNKDSVWHVYNSTTGVTTNLMLASDSFGSDLGVSGPWSYFPVSERRQANTNLNAGSGDTDTSDIVLHVYDDTTGIVTNLGVDVGTPDSNDISIREDIVAFHVDESGQNGVDLNGDGDGGDDVMHVYSFTTGALVNAQLAITEHVIINSNVVAAEVAEGSQGFTDFNGDFDTADRILQLFLPTSGTTVNLGLAVSIFSSPTANSIGELLVFPVDETSQGGTDLNNDGDASDLYIFYKVGR